MTEAMVYNPKNLERIRKFLDESESLNPVTQPGGTKNFVYTPVNGKGLISLNTWEGTVYCSPLLDEDIRYSELKKGLLKLTR
jgi:hypothetical protein